MKELEQEIAALDDRLPLEKMTLQELKQAHPELVNAKTSRISSFAFCFEPNLWLCFCSQGPNVAYPTPSPHDDPEVNRKWRIYIAAKEKGLKATKPDDE